MKKTNLYTVADLLAAATAITFACAKQGNLNPKWCYYSAFGLLGVMLYQKLAGTTVVTNHYGEIWVKPEDGETPYITSDETITGADGVKIAGKVYKFRNGTHCTINADGSVTLHALTAKLVNRCESGLLTAPPDDSWKPLFEA